MKRILKTKHKLIGFIGIILVLDLVLVGALMKPVNADRKTEDYDAAAEISTSLNVAAMQAKLTLEDESKAVIKSGKAERTKTQGTEKWLDTLETLEGQIFAHGITYSWYHPASSYESAVNGNHHVNCAAYVSWGLQRMGLLPHGTTFYISDTLHGKGASYIKNSEYFTVKYNLGHPGSAGLEPGDIVGWKTHTCVYAGKDSNGNMLWYTAGGSDVSSKNLGPRTKKYANKNITVLIRINYDKIPKN